MNPTLSIRRATAQDAAAYARIMGDPAVFPNLMQLPYASEERWRAQLTETLAAQQRVAVHGGPAGLAGRQRRWC